MSDSIIDKLKNTGLTGRGGGCFPTGEKWEMVAQAAGEEKYVVCNASEGEPGVRKDWHILDNHGARVIDGMKIALDFLGAKEGFIYLNPDYFSKLENKLKRNIGTAPITVFRKPHIAGYAGGEESSALNALEGRRIEPRLRPPYPPTHGYLGQPTLVNNVETFYAVSLAIRGEYRGKRFYTINGDCLYDGVYEYPESWTIETLLKKTDNWPNFDFFVQSGGDASGEVLNSSQLKRPVGGSGALTIYSIMKHDPVALLRRWAGFFRQESCGQCTPCREGTYRVAELLNDKKPDWKMIGSLLINLRDTSFCGLGCAAPTAIRSYIENVLEGQPAGKINLPPEERKMICECFT